MNKEIIIHNIELSKSGKGLSGGEKFLLEFVSNSIKINGFVTNYIYTSSNGVETYSKMISPKKQIKFELIGKYSIEERFGVIISYIYKSILCLSKIKSFEKNKRNVIFTHSEFFPNLIYAYLLKLKNPKAMWIGLNHMMAPNPIKGFKYTFVKGKYCFPKINAILYWLSKKLYFIISRKMDLLVTVNPSYKEIFEKYNKTLLIVYGGVEKAAYKKKKMDEKIYDACFVGRFHEQKGIFDLIEVVEQLKINYKKDFKLIVVGDYNNKIGKNFKKLCEKKSLANNIIFAGLKCGKEKDYILNNSKLFLFPSYYESFGIVYLEAISMGVPVIEYDLPIYQMHKKGVIKVEYLNRLKFAQAIKGVLEDQKMYNKLSIEGIKYSKNFIWAKSAKRILNKIIWWFNDKA